MKEAWFRGRAVLATAAKVAASVVLWVSTAQAQTPAQVPAPPAQAGSDTRLERTPKVTLTTLIKQMNRDSGVSVLVDRSVPEQDVAPLKDATTGDNLEDRLTTLAKSLPIGTVWAKVYLPDKGRTYSGDAVADYVLVQAGLFGKVGGATPVGSVEVMGQRVSGEQAQTIRTALALKPVYVLLNATTRTAGATVLNGNWASLTPAQQRQQTQQAAQALLNMTPDQRAGVVQQQMATMQAMFQGMTPDQRQQMMQVIGSAMRGTSGQ